MALRPHYNIFSFPGRIFYPCLADWGLIGRDTLLMLSYSLCAAFVLFLGVCSSMWHFIATVGALGGFVGVCNTYYFSIIARYLGSERLPFIFGMMGAIGGTAFLFMPVAVGKIASVTARDH